MDPREGGHILQEAGEIGGGLNRAGVELQGQIYKLEEDIVTLKELTARLKDMRDEITEYDPNEGDILLTIGNTLISLKKVIYALKTQKRMVELANTNLIEASRQLDKFGNKLAGIPKAYLHWPCSSSL